MTRGGKRKGAGRPKGSTTAEPTRVLSVRVLEREYAAYEADAAKYGLSLVQYVKWGLWNMLHRASWKKRATRGARA
jgi:hypothetical protein